MFSITGNVRFVNNSNCGISLSINALAFDKPAGKYDIPNHMEAKFIDCVVDNRGQGLADSDGMGGVILSGFAAALRGTVDFTRLRVIGGNSPALLLFDVSSDGVQTTVRDSLFEHNSNGGVAWLPQHLGKFDSGWTENSHINGIYSNSPISIQPNWGEPALLANHTYGGLEFINTSVLYSPTVDR